MMRYGAFLFVSTTAALISCSQDRASPANPDVDEAVIAVVLEDFANWKQATFGELEGVLELEPGSEANPNATAQEVRSLAPEIQNRLDKDVVNAFMERNRLAAPVAPLFSGSPSLTFA